MYIYRITNVATGNFYYGQRSAYVGAPEDDTNYWSSSKLVKELRLHRPQNWIKEIVSTHTTKDELDAAEIEMIREHWGHPLLLNRSVNETKPAGWSRGKKLSSAHVAAIKAAFLNNPSRHKTGRAFGTEAGRARAREVLSRPVEVNGHHYASIAEASRKTGMTRATITSRLTNNAPGYKQLIPPTRKN